MKKVDRLKSKILLTQMKTILLQEKRKSYYRNEINVREIIPLSNDTKLVIYENGMFDFVLYHEKKLIKERR
ncbi:MAG: hypothetical protein SO108_03210 [Bacilli bacterium]|nr:hypothetical protein [Bacilli bacterium]